MNKQTKELLIIGGIIGGGIGLYYLLTDNNIFHVGSSTNSSPIFLSPEATEGTMPASMQSNVAGFATATPSVTSYSATHNQPTEYTTGISNFVMGFDITAAIKNANNNLIPQANTWLTSLKNCSTYNTDTSLLNQMKSLYNQLVSYSNSGATNEGLTVYQQIQADYKQIQTDYNNYASIQQTISSLISQAGPLVSQAKSWASAINSSTDTNLYNQMNSAYVDLQSQSSACSATQAQSDFNTIQTNYNTIQSDYNNYQNQICQSNLSKAGQLVSQAQSWSSTINSSTDTALYNQMNSYYTTMQQMSSCNPATSTTYLNAIQADYNQIQADYQNYQALQRAMAGAYGVYYSGTLTGHQLHGCCNWWTQPAAQGNWNVTSISGGNATLNLNQLEGSVIIPISQLQQLVTTGQANINLNMGNTTGYLTNLLNGYQNGNNPPYQETDPFYLQGT